MAENKNDNFNEEQEGFFKRKINQTKYGIKKNINYEEIQATNNFVKSMAEDAFSVKKKLKNAKVENFEKAIERRGVTDFELIALYKNYSIIFYMSLFFCAICLLFIVYLVLTDFQILSLCSAISIFAVCFANAFKFSFRAFQIKYRKLCGVSDYLEKKDYFPSFNLNK